MRFLLSCLCLATAVASLSADFPTPQKYVSDGADVLSGRSRTEIKVLLEGVERDTTAEIALVTVSSLDGMTVEEYANRLFKEWGIGKKGADNGVLVLVAPTERKMRIEVGYGLEPILPDGLAGEIIRQEFTPAFKNGDYNGGIQAGVTRVAEIVRAKHVLTPEERKRLEEAATFGDRPPTLLTTPFFGAFVAIGAFMIGAGFASKTGFPLMFGSLFGGIPFLMAMIPFFNAWRLGLVLWAIAALAFGYRRGGAAFAAGTTSAAGSRRARLGRLRSSRASSDSGWTWGAGSGGSSGSSGSSSSGGSYGGGSSGGGGASGSW